MCVQQGTTTAAEKKGVNMTMTLEDGKIGEEYLVKEMDLPLAVHMRLRSLGMTEGTCIRVLNRKRKGAIIFKVRGTRLAVGRKIASCITTEKKDTKD